MNYGRDASSYLVEDYDREDECDRCSYPANYFVNGLRYCSYHASQAWKKEGF